MGEAGTLPAQDAVVRVGRGVLGHCRAEAGAHLHALKDEVHPKAVMPLHAPQPGAHIVFLAHPLLGPLHGNPMIARKGLDHRLYSVVRWRKTSLVMAPTPCTSRKKWTMFSGRVSSGKWPRMTMRSKQWYTRATRLPNSLANSSIGPLPPLRWVGTESMGLRAGGGQRL